MNVISRLFKRKITIPITTWEPKPLPIPYMLPKDAQEINRLDMQHYILHKAFQANFLAPIQNVRTILDIGSGTGRWVKEMSEYAPYITVHGFDLDLSTLPLPTNCSFTRGNILNGLPYSNDSFDFVHQRLLVLGLPFHTWPGVVQEIVRVTRQGSWVELVECDLHFSHQGTYTRDFIGWLDQASKQRGIDIGIGQKIKSFLEAAGLVHIEEHTKELPLGNWGNHLGKMLLSDFRAAAKQTIKPIIINSLHIDPIIYDFTVDQWIQECERYQETCQFTIAYGQKGIQSWEEAKSQIPSNASHPK